jgi:hypothetical protein
VLFHPKIFDNDQSFRAWWLAEGTGVADFGLPPKLFSTKWLW